MNIFNVKMFRNYCLFILLFLYISNAHCEELITSITADETIGFKQTPIVHVELEIDKTRDLHVAFQTLDGSRTLKTTMKRIKESGKYHFEVPIENLTSGKYRIASYLTPRGKNWNDRIYQAPHFLFNVVDQETYVETTAFSSQDKIKLVEWPKQIVGLQEATLKINYEITQPRDIHIKLLDSDNWKEFGSIKYSVAEPGNISIPFSQLTNDFPAGNYAWVIFISVNGETENIGKKYGKHFTLVQQETE